MSKTPIYNVWNAMHSRCSNPNVHRFCDYGGRGIKVCERWSKFENFYADMGLPPKGWTLERKDNNGHYCKENCEWASRKVQGVNKRNNIWLTYDGKTMTLSQWAEHLGLPYGRLRVRHAEGHPIEKILEAAKCVNQFG